MTIIAMACQVAYFLIMGYGVYVCWRAYRCSKKKAWLLVGTFCLSSFLGLGMQQLSKAMYRRAGSQPQHEQVMSEDGQLIPFKTKTINLPIFPFLLVAGLSFLAEDEIKKNQMAHRDRNSPCGEPLPHHPTGQ